MKSPEDFKNGLVLLIDKPVKWTSFQVVNKIRWMLNKKLGIKKIKVGHAGTLDPLATGLLILCTGRMTKRIEDYQSKPKSYTGSLRLGSTTPSYDLETEIDQTYRTDHINSDLIRQTALKFIGRIEQLPPMYSAVKKDGKRLYELARKGQTTELKPREIEIAAFEITNISGLDIDFEVRCSKGTYIRSLVHDFGQALKSGAHLTALRRTAIGEFSVEDAMTVEQFVESLD
ncbi:MAG: tRNA pseudouridine(55) synthase TruB [Flavobacteriaceae bacterium]|nr:tRNA pseudouridine(55) synthase TruB [Flavobacteriaceae bacterium]